MCSKGFQNNVPRISLPVSRGFRLDGVIKLEKLQNKILTLIRFVTWPTISKLKFSVSNKYGVCNSHLFWPALFHVSGLFVRNIHVLASPGFDLGIFGLTDRSWSEVNNWRSETPSFSPFPFFLLSCSKPHKKQIGKKFRKLINTISRPSILAYRSNWGTIILLLKGN
jgi:hypothetical protein